jgi:hypothetical protein
VTDIVQNMEARTRLAEHVLVLGPCVE